jgi:hypothetical protein
MGNYQTTLNSAGGIILVAYSFNPNQSVEWTDYTSLYDEFRVIGVEWIYIPVNRYNSGSNTADLLIAFDNDDSTAPASGNEVLQYSTRVITGANDPIKLVFKRPTAGAPVPWLDVGSPATSLGSVKVAASYTGSGTVLMGQVFLRYVIEFRGIR